MTLSLSNQQIADLNPGKRLKQMLLFYIFFSFFKGKAKKVNYHLTSIGSFLCRYGYIKKKKNISYPFAVSTLFFLAFNI